MAKKMTRSTRITPAGQAALDDPAVLVGHLTVVVTKSGRLTWQLARMDRASKRMVFEESGELSAPPRGYRWFTEVLVQAAEHAYDETHCGPL